jgi:hypothetical protein
MRIRSGNVSNFDESEEFTVRKSMVWPAVRLHY